MTIKNRSQAGDLLMDIFQVTSPLYTSAPTPADMEKAHTALGELAVYLGCLERVVFDRHNLGAELDALQAQAEIDWARRFGPRAS